jgi:hypothetical protein
MSVLGGGDFSGLDLGSPGAAAYARGAIITAGVLAGWSGAATLAALRSAGLGVRTQSFYNAFSEAKARYEQGQSAAAVPPEVVAGESVLGQPPPNWTGRYVHQVTATFRVRNPEGTYAYVTRTMGILSDQLLTPEQAARSALGILETGEAATEEERYPSVSNLLNLSTTGVWYHTRPGSFWTTGE